MLARFSLAQGSAIVAAVVAAAVRPQPDWPIS
jgi:hypothetical protein